MEYEVNVEKSIPLNFTVDCLEKPLKNKTVTTTIRHMSFIKRFGYKPGVKIEIKFHRKRVGFAIITSIRPITYQDLFDPVLIEKEGFESAEELIKTLKNTSWQFYWDKIQAGKMTMPLLEFKWL